MTRIGINGFGRIGRALFKLNERHHVADIVAINDIDPDLHNHAYLLKYDSVYGRFPGTLGVGPDGSDLQINGRSIRFYAHETISKVPWGDHGIDLVVDATGVASNVGLGRGLVARGELRKVIVTHVPQEPVDLALVFGVTEHCYDPDRHHVVSTSICDAVAGAPVLRLLDQAFGVAGGYVTTMHPWLSYQNLVDGPVRSISNPGHMWSDFALGRSSPMNLIPKNTTLVNALACLVPDIAASLQAISFRVPTSIVTVSDCTLTLRSTPSADALNTLFRRAAADSPDVIGYEEESLVSVDFVGVEQSVVVDGRWTRANEGGQVKVVFWYDNELGYSRRVLDAVRLMTRGRSASAENTR